MRRLVYGEENRLSIAVTDAENQSELIGVVLLPGEFPRFERVDNPQQMMVLAYSGRVVWEANQQGLYESTARHLFNKPGALIADKDGWMLNVGKRANFGDIVTHFQHDVSTGQLKPYIEQLGNIAIFGEWSVYLEEQDRPVSNRLKLLDFKIEPEKGNFG